MSVQFFIGDRAACVTPSWFLKRTWEVLRPILVFWVVFAVFGNVLISIISEDTGHFLLGTEFPWSGWVDFIEIPDGTILIHLSTYSRVQRYRSDGTFLGAWGGFRTRGIFHWTVTKDARLFKCWGNSVSEYDLFGNFKYKFSTEEPGIHAWKYDDSRPESFEVSRVREDWVVLPEAPDIPTSVVGFGDVLCTPKSSRDFYMRQSGGKMVRRGNRLDVYDEDGRLVSTLGTPWYLWWFQFPFPAFFMSFAVMFAFLMIEAVKKSKSRVSADSRVDKDQ